MVEASTKGGEGKRRKATCPTCKVYRWIEDFSGASYKDLIAQPTPCDFCQLRKEHKQEVNELKEEIKSLYQIVNMLKVGSVGQQRNTEITQEVSNETPKDKEKENPKKNTNDRPVTISTTKPEESQTTPSCVELTTKVGSGRFIRVSRRKASKSCRKPVQPVPIPTSNRYNLLCSEEGEAILVGDSQVRDQERHFGSTGGTKRKVRCLSGRKTKDIRKEVEKIKTRDRSTAIVAQVSGNDLFLKNGNTGNTEEIIIQAMSMVDDLKLKTDRALVIGILPRLKASNHALSKAIGINERLVDLCKSDGGVWFMDPYNLFYGRNDLYLADGVHLNGKGKAVLGDMVNQVLYRLIRSTLVKGKNSRKNSMPKDRNAPEELSVEVAPQGENKLDTVSQTGEEATSEGTCRSQGTAVATAATVVPDPSRDDTNPSGNVSGQEDEQS